MVKPIKLYTWGTPNGHKISIFLEILQLPYEVHSVDITKNESKQEWFVKLNPNGRIPTIEDPNTGITLSQTGAILQYLADKYDTDLKYSYKYGTPEYYKTLEYLIFQVAENGPIQGQANHFKVYAKEKIQYGIDRYINDTKRIYGVYEDILSRNAANQSLYLVGSHYTVADFALFGWANRLERLEIDIHQWPLLSKWFTKLAEISEVQKGLTVG
ncbi:unnamed protein product [Candida verbasci]|uniref:Glutathione S-transferase n=1 Tax=Candida verbasci TaxID=1227364 RepID=A0A9W4TXA3_9ASCO|nr:unnamed protein product [Candida verbasci]